MSLVPARTRTRWLLVTGTAAVCAAVVVTGTVAANAGEKTAAPRPSASQSALPAEPAATATQETTRVLGDVIASGIKSKQGEWVFYGVAVKEASLPDTDFGIMLGRRLPSGELADGVMANEAEGSDTAPGFHAVSGSMNVDYRDTPTFGYYAGPAAKITAKVGGRTVTAKQAAWSEDPSVVVFWFAPKSSVKDLAAFDASGKKLPTGNSTVGVG